jgi:hypothetical protein
MRDELLEGKQGEGRRTKAEGEQELGCECDRQAKTTFFRNIINNSDKL